MKEKNADKMFEELGYFNDNQSSEDCIEYEKIDLKRQKQEYFIVLNLIDNTVIKTLYDWENDTEYPSEITFQELQAIYQKCKELEWSDVK